MSPLPTESELLEGRNCLEPLQVKLSAQIFQEEALEECPQKEKEGIEGGDEG